MKMFTVRAEWDAAAGVYCLACEEAGCFSQVTGIADAAEELREAIAYQTGLAEGAFMVDVVQV
ncbi:hypothetical protein H8R18_01070 [Nanchangia anserum]|uniref:Uncharacterized protein n=1 Tax=Nanchangia anserum TaxID=2692125 RepID=A0A8I0KWB0_9ACTO|nr:hypothetical protein [Nanchangia anserum]MBD3689829.1 hypothetical protein [Nanchangia anserum]QOX81999.1 hypothetical protein H8R18_01070 [Nanchangia anserum]